MRIFKDTRGSIKFINDEMLSSTKQQFISISHKNVLRGIHCSPYGKYITCLNGSIIDYIINFNKSITYKKYTLDSNNNCRLYIPPNHGHLYIALENNTQILYQLEGKFNPNTDKNFNYKDPFINLDISNNNHYILSEKDNNSPFIYPIDFIVLGGNGYIGSNICGTLKNMKKYFIKLDTRLENFELLEYQLKLYKPKYVISAAGISGKPSIKWCETHREETLYTNLTLQLNMINLCKRLGIHLTICGSGLVYNGNKEFSENDKPNFDKYYYSKVRIILEECLKEYNIFYPRILYPMSSCGNIKSFLTKLVKLYYKNIDNQKVNITVLDSLLPHMINLVEQKFVGTLNFVNPNAIKLNSILELYKNNVDKDFTWILKHTSDKDKKNSAACLLNTNKLQELCPHVENVEKAITKIMHKINKYNSFTPI